MDKNKKLLIIFGVLLVFLIIFLGAREYQRQQGMFEKEAVENENKEFFSLSNPNPINFQEFFDFIEFCKNARLADIDELKNEEIKQVVCIQTKKSSNFIDLYGHGDKPYLPLVHALKSVSSLESDRYVGISVDVNDIIRKYDPSLLEKDKVYLCNISEPSWIDDIILEIEPEQNLIFEEGDIFCADINLNKDAAINFSGFIPKANSLDIKSYLVDEKTVSSVMSKQSFLETKEILKNYPIIWQMEKSIVPLKMHIN